MERTDQPTTSAMTSADIAAHQAASYVRTRQDEDPNGPAIPKIPGPRKPRPGSAYPTERLPAVANVAIRRLERALPQAVTS